MAEVASAYVSLIPSARNFGSGITSAIGGEVDKAGEGAGHRFGGRFREAMHEPLAHIGEMVGGLFAADKIKDFLGESIGAAREQQREAAITEQVIKSTGGAAHVSATQIDGLARSISEKTGIDDDAIKSGQRLLLTFTDIRNEAGKGNDVFNQATSIITDMSASLGQDMKSSAIQVGKALNDPVKGVSALQRVGVSFSQSQKDTIDKLVKTGHAMDAQKLILHELNREFGGAAAAAANPADKAKVAWEEFKKTLGTALLPTVDKVLTGLTGLVNFLTDHMGPAFKKVGAFVRPLTDAMKVAGDHVGKFANVIGQSFKGHVTDTKGISTGFAGVAITVGRMARTMEPQLKAAGSGVGKFFSVIGQSAKGHVTDTKGLTEGFAGVAITIGRMVRQVGPLLNGMFKAALPLIKQVAAVVGPFLAGAFKTLTPILTQLGHVLLGAFKQAGPILEHFGKQSLTAILGAVRQLLPVFISVGRTVMTTILPAIRSLAIMFVSQVLPMILKVREYFQAHLLPIFIKVATIIGTQVVPIVAKLVAFLVTSVIPVVISVAKNIGEKLKPVFDAVFKVIQQNVLPAVQQLLAKFREWMPTIQHIISVVVMVIGKILEFAAAILGKVLPPVIKFAGFLIGVLFNAIGKVIGAVISIIAHIVDFGAALLGGVVKAGQFVLGITKKFLDVGKTVAALPGKIIGWLGNMGLTLLNAGADLIKGFISGITSMGGTLLHAVTKFIEDHVPGPIKKLLGIASPSRVFRDIGKNVGHGFVQGIKDSHAPVERAMAGMTKKVTDGLDPRSLRGGLSLAVGAAATDRLGSPTLGAAGAAGGATHSYDQRIYIDRMEARDVADFERQADRRRRLAALAVG